MVIINEEVGGYDCHHRFWDSNLTWNSAVPDLTECFQESVLVILPCVIFWFAAVINLYINWRRTLNTHVPWTPLNIVKLLFCTFLFITCCVEFGFAMSVKLRSMHVFPLDTYSSCIRIITFLLTFIVIMRNKSIGRTSSTLLTLFWLVMCLCNIVIFRSTLLRAFYNKTEPIMKYKYVFNMVYFPLMICQFIFSVIPDQKAARSLEVKSPFEEAPFFSFLTFYWFNSIIKKGRKQLLTIEDFPPQPSKTIASYVWSEFEVKWTNEMQKFKSKVALYDDESKEKLTPRLAFTIFKTFWPWIVVTFSFQFIYASLMVCPPLLLDQLLKFISRRDYVWKGYVIAFTIFVVEIFGRTVFNFMIYYSTCFSLQLQSTIISAIYRKSVRLSSSAKRNYTTGEIINLVSVDLEKMYQFSTYFSFLLGFPIEGILTIILLWEYLGPSSLSGIAVVSGMIVLTVLVSRTANALQKQQMETKDSRLKFMAEILNGIKILKLYAWEIPFMKKLTGIREEEANLIRSFKIVFSLFSFTWRSASFLVAIACFVTYIFVSENHVLNPVTVFVSLTIMNILRFAVAQMPMVVGAAIQSAVSMKRIATYLAAEERNDEQIGDSPDNGETISIRNASINWNSIETSNLKNIDFHAPEGRLIAVIGPVGSGKSSLLSAILGDMTNTSGSIDVKGKIAYVPQQAWILNKTVKDNILFVDSMKRNLYDKIIDNCCLKPDLQILPAGDETEIGEKGVNLSGGQKQRVSVARAVYSDADVYLLDDPLSALDAHVGKDIFDNVIGNNGLLKNKTRILVTHNTSILPDVDYIITMRNGRIEEQGTYNELLSQKELFAEIMNECSNISDEDAISIDNSLEFSTESTNQRIIIGRSMSVVSTKSDVFQRSISSDAPNYDFNEGRIIEDEKMEIGEVDKKALITYGQHMKWRYLIGMALGYMCYQSFEAGANIWLSQWSNDPAPINGTQDIYLRNKRIGVYAAFGCVQIICILFGTTSLAFGASEASKRFHFDMIQSVMRTPMSFFDTTPLGRIMNRFSKDMDDIDTAIPQYLDGCLFCVFNILATFVIVGYTSPLFLPFLIPIGFLYYTLQKLFLKTSRQIKRLSSTSRSPIYSHLAESIQGSSSINAYNVAETFIQKTENLINTFNKCEFMWFTCSRWLDLYLAAIGDTIIFLAAVLAVAYKDNLDASAVGLSITYVFFITDVINYLVLTGTDLENKLVAIERVSEYSNLDPEAPWEIPDEEPPSTWPPSGQIAFKNYSTKYRENLDLVLRDINLQITQNEKIGIVGRTGAGKSSFTLALFRMIEPVTGSIVIDDINVSEIGLHQLRSKLTIIPQDPTLFTGTLRSNLDPNEGHTDNDIWWSLEHANMKEHVSSLPDGLSHEIAEGGENLSVGQRQLLCLARALLKKTKILVLDEATAAVDVETDQLIQKTIRNEFKDHTVITIAHRLNTIMDYDRIVVMEDGRISETGKPSVLLQGKNSTFYNMAKNAGLI